MRFITTIATIIATTNAFHKGLNYGATLPDGACRSQADWQRAFSVARSSPAGFTSARLFASSDCDTLARAVPAALNTGIKLLVGVWTQNDEHFGQEKDALLRALQNWPNWQDWMLAVSVGSEDLYRKEAPAWQIAQKIYDVRGMLRAKGVNAQVGHVDTWTAWVDGANTDVLNAVDFIGTDGYPYWQGALPVQASDVFWASVNAVRDTVNRVKPGTPIWVTETGWPVSGKNFQQSIASVDNARQYWKNVACPAFSQIDLFWYAYSEPRSDPSFSLWDASDRPIYDLSC